VSPVEPSPYYPSSRRWRNPLLIRVEDVTGAAAAPIVAELAAQAHALLAEPVVDRDRSWDVKRRALEHLWSTRSDRARDDLARWRAEQGAPLEGWARFCALAEVHGAGWSTWPAELRRLDSPAVDEAAAQLADRVAFHAWLQQLLDGQLAAAAAGGVRLIQDLAIGVDPDGADAWVLQDLLALGTSVGAPPDDFARDGQSWGLPPFIPWRLRDAGYRPFAELLRASMADGGGLRVDHVMGLSRLFWIPEGGVPADGTYVRFSGRELLDVLAMESARAGAVVVGEDLGTVEPEFRRELHDTRVLSTRLVWFEDDPPERYPKEVLAMVTTHDLPTIAGVWTGADDAELAALGRPAPAEASARVRDRLARLVELPADAEPCDVAVAVHRRLAQSPAQLVLATLEDVCGLEARPNVPGTTDERANWSAALPRPIEDMCSDEVALAVVDAIGHGRSTSD
jgi:4-alpha-glucanotransferase